MKSEAIQAIASNTMRPEALEAATSLGGVDKMPQADATDEASRELPSNGLAQKSIPDRHANTHLAPGSAPTSPREPSTPLGQRIEGTSSAVKAIEGIAHGVKAAVDGTLEWAEKKAEQLRDETGGTGPYPSPATCAPTDLDAITNGVLPALPAPEERSEEGAGAGCEAGQYGAEKGSKERNGKL